MIPGQELHLSRTANSVTVAAKEKNNATHFPSCIVFIKTSLFGFDKVLASFFRVRICESYETDVSFGVKTNYAPMLFHLQGAAGVGETVILSLGCL